MYILYSQAGNRISCDVYSMSLLLIYMQMESKAHKLFSVSCIFRPDLIGPFSAFCPVPLRSSSSPVGTEGLMLIICLLDPVLRTHMVSLG